MSNRNEHGHSHSHHTHDDHTHEHSHPHPHPHVHENKRIIVNRLSRALGHLEKVRQMVENDVDCSEVLVQLAAVRSALDNAGKVILKDHLRHCIVEAAKEGDREAVDNICNAIDKFMK